MATCEIARFTWTARLLREPPGPCTYSSAPRDPPGEQVRWTTSTCSHQEARATTAGARMPRRARKQHRASVSRPVHPVDTRSRTKADARSRLDFADAVQIYQCVADRRSSFDVLLWFVRRPASRRHPGSADRVCLQVSTSYGIRCSGVPVHVRAGRVRLAFRLLRARSSLSSAQRLGSLIATDRDGTLDTVECYDTPAVHEVCS